MYMKKDRYEKLFDFYSNDGQFIESLDLKEVTELIKNIQKHLESEQDGISKGKEL